MIDLREIASAFMVLFAVIDITGSIPMILDIKAKQGEIKPLSATAAAMLILLLFFFLGESILLLFGVDISSFAIAGSFILMILALEMVLGVEFFKHESNQSASIVPIAFPLVAGAGSITTILSIKAEFHTLNILIALAVNMLLVYIVLRATSVFEKILGKAGILILKKIFGLILMAMAIKLFTSNTGIILGR